MSRKENLHNRCKGCMMHMSMCLCSLFEAKLETRTRVLLVIHRAEIRKPTNTGHLATKCLVNSSVLVRGNEEEPTEAIDFGDSEPVLLFPHDGVTELVPVDHPVTLIVPDGNWRQASKVRARVPGLKDVRCVTLPPGPPSIYRLRTEAHDHGLATAEAIARAMGILEGPHVHDALMHVFRTMVERTLWIRVTIPASEVTTRLPPGVTKHEPRSGVQPGEGAPDEPPT